MATWCAFGHSMRFFRWSVLLFALLLVSCGGGNNSRPAGLPVTGLSVGVAVSDVVPVNGFTAYSVSVNQGFLYKISITGVTDDADLLYFGTDGSFSSSPLCVVDNTSIDGISPEGCIDVAPGSTLYFGVDGTFLNTSSAAYTIVVEFLDITDLNLGSPILDATTRTSAAVYAVSTQAGQAFVGAVTGLNNDADLHVYLGDTLQPAVCTGGNNTLFAGSTPEDCRFTAADPVAYLIVDGIFSTSPTVLFTAFAAQAPVVALPGNEGSALAPVFLSGDTLRTGQAAFGGTSFYAVSGLTPGARYTASINGLTNDADLTVYTDGTYTTPAACLIDNRGFTGTTPESCTVSAGGTLHFTVTAHSFSGGVAYLTLVEPGP